MKPGEFPYQGPWVIGPTPSDKELASYDSEQMFNIFVLKLKKINVTQAEKKTYDE